MSNNIDSIFKKTLQNKTYEPPTHIWNSILQRLEARKKRKRIFVFWYSGAAMLALLIALYYWSDNRVANDTMDMYALNKPALTIKDLKRKDYSQKLVNAPLVSLKMPITHVYEKEIVRIQPVEIQQLEKEEKHIPLPVINNNIQSIRTVIIPLVSKESFKNNLSYKQLLALNSTDKNLPTVEKRKDIKFSLSGNIAPGYASGQYNAPTGNQRSKAYASDQMSGVFSLSGGLKVAMHTDSRWSVQAGVSYTRIGQQTDENDVYVSRSPAMLATLQGNQSISSPLGKINGKSKSVIYRTEALPLLKEQTEKVNIEQLFDAIEIPLAVRYRLNNNKIKVSIVGGFSSSFIVGNKAFLNYGREREFLGKTEDIRTFNISTDWAIGLEYPISPKIKIMLEPGFKYYLQSISRNTDVDFKPYIFSFSTGIGINF